MNTNDKIWYETATRGLVEAEILSIVTNIHGHEIAVIKVTERTNKFFSFGEVLDVCLKYCLPRE